MIIYQPYTYRIKWTALNVSYYGVRYAKGCHPKDLFNPYKTSSDYVKHLIVEHGMPDIIEIRKTFNDKQSAQIWETRVLAKLKVLNNPLWLNKNIGGVVTNTKKPSGFAKGKSNSMYGRKRPDTILYNKTRKHPLLNKKRPEHSTMMSGLNNPMAEIGKSLLFWNNGIKTIRAKECPGDGWYRGRVKHK